MRRNATGSARRLGGLLRKGLRSGNEPRLDLGAEALDVPARVECGGRLAVAVAHQALDLLEGAPRLGEERLLIGAVEIGEPRERLLVVRAEGPRGAHRVVGAV